MINKKALIVGAGIGGLAVSIRLALKGFDVTVFEKNSQPGGKIGEFVKDGFRFDTGPSVFTLPDLVDELFKLAGYDPGEYFIYKKLEESARYFYEDGTIIDAYSDTVKFIEELTAKTGETPSNIKKFLNKSETIYNLTSELFVFNSIHESKNLFKISSLKALLNFHKIDAFTTMHKSNKKRFNSEKVTRFFDRYATYNGSNPYKVPGTLNIIPHLEHNIGAFFPEKGMYSIVQALYDLALRVGVSFHFNTKVESIRTHKRDIKELLTDKGSYKADYLVSNVDINFFYENLLIDQPKLKEVMKHEKSSSALIYYWAMNKEFPELRLHNILFSENYASEFESLFNKKLIYHDPTIYIFISSKNNKTDAPEGKENWYVMVNAPENTGQDWDIIKSRSRDNIINKINRTLNVNIEKYIELEEVHDPITIEESTASYHGSLYGNSSNSKFAAFNRHPNFSKKYNGLYFVGGSVHPGGGIPLCLASAKIVAEKIKP